MNPNNFDSVAFFVWGTTTNYGNNGPNIPLGSTNVFIAVTNLGNNLLPATVYHFSLAVSNSTGITIGPDQTFTTANDLPLTLTQPATSSLATNGAILNAFRESERRGDNGLVRLGSRYELRNHERARFDQSHQCRGDRQQSTYGIAARHAVSF